MTHINAPPFSIPCLVVLRSEAASVSRTMSSKRFSLQVMECSTILLNLRPLKHIAIDGCFALVFVALRNVSRVVALLP